MKRSEPEEPRRSSGGDEQENASPVVRAASRNNLETMGAGLSRLVFVVARATGEDSVGREHATRTLTREHGRFMEQEE